MDPDASKRAVKQPLGTVLAWVAGGGVLYVMIYLLALSKLQGWENLLFDGLFLTVNGVALVQIWRLGCQKVWSPSCSGPGQWVGTRPQRAESGD